MAELSKIVGIHQFIQQKLEVERKTYKEISEELLQLYGPMTGLSADSVKRFCVRSKRLSSHVAPFGKRIGSGFEMCCCRSKLSRF